MSQDSRARNPQNAPERPASSSLASTSAVTTTMSSSSASSQPPPQPATRRRDGSKVVPQTTLSFYKRYKTEIAASSSSAFSTLVAFPLDSVKTRMQTYQYRGFLDCVKHTYRTESLQGFFRGVTAPMASITLVRTMSFSIYIRAKYSYCAWVKRNFGTDILRQVNSPGNYPTMHSIATFGAAGATAGSIIPFIACPFELSKLSSQVAVLLTERGTGSKARRELAASYQNKGTLRTMATIMKHRGTWGLYTGFRLHLLRDTLGTGIYFMVYESGKQLGTTFAGDSSNKLAVVAAGGLCGLVSWAIISKSIYQRNSLLFAKGEKVEPRPKITFFKKQMYRGLGVSMGRSCVVNAIFFSSFEFIKKRIKTMDD